jgi:hypothetical protein
MYGILNPKDPKMEQRKSNSGMGELVPVGSMTKSARSVVLSAGLD